MQNKAQSWSVDFIIAVTIFISVLIVFYSFSVLNAKEKPKELQLEASLVAKEARLHKSPIAIIDKETVNETKLGKALDKDYETIKKELGLKNDFCIHFEDEDGKVVEIKQGVTGIGSPNIKVGGIKCT